MRFGKAEALKRTFKSDSGPKALRPLSGQLPSFSSLPEQGEGLAGGRCWARSWRPEFQALFCLSMARRMTMGRHKELYFAKSVKWMS